MIWQTTRRWKAPGSASRPCTVSAQLDALTTRETSLVRPHHWGMPLLLLAVGTVVGLAILRLLLVTGYSVKDDVARLWMTAAVAERYLLLPYALALLLTFLSYPRISDFKLTFLVVSAACGAAWGAMLGQPALVGAERWLMGATMSSPALVLSLLGAGNLVVATLMPDVQRSVLTWELSVGVIVGQLVALGVFSRALVPWLLEHPQFFGYPFPPQGYVMGLSVLAVLLSRWLVTRNYGLGGGIAGIALLGLAMPALRGTSLDPACAIAPGVYLLLMVVYVWSVRLRYRVSYDPLMQIYNRAHCDEILAEGLGAWVERTLAVAMIDVDHFKELNDRHGHAVGDDVLHRVAQAVRREGLPQGICCRYGGEEIIVFLADTPAKEAEKIFAGMRQAVEHLSVQNGKRTVKVTVSIGWTFAPQHSTRPLAELVGQADRALYRAKDEGRNRVVHG